MAVVRRLSYQERQALEQQDAQFLPLPMSADPRWVYAQLRQIVRLLRNRQSASPCADAVLYVAGLFERTIQMTVPDFNRSIACKSGCSYCCSQPVAITMADAFLLAAAVRENPEAAAAVKERARIMEGRDPSAGGRWAECPLLIDKACSFYAARPFNCRSYFSLNVNDCVNTFMLLGKSSVRAPMQSINAADMMRGLLFAALKYCGKSYRTYELVSATAAALAHDDAETRWWRGEDIFSGALIRPELPPGQQTNIAAMASAVAPTL